MGKPILDVLAGRQVGTPPVWFMRQAGRYLPEYREIRSKAPDFVSFCLNPALAAEVTLQPLRRYPFDAAIVFADILLVPYGLGQRVRFVEGDGPQVEVVRSASDLSRLNLSSVVPRLEPVGETLGRVKAELGASVALIGFAGSPWTVATYMVQGSGSSDQAEARLWAYRDQDGFGALISVLTEATISYLDMQVRAGADVLQLFDSWATMLPEQELAAWVIGPTRTIVRAMKRRHPEVPIIGFPRGCRSLARYARETGVDAIGLDTGVSIQDAAEELQPICPVQGNLDPLALVAGGETLDRMIDAIKGGLSGGGHIFNLGHGIVPQTPPDHVDQAVRRIRGRT